MEIEYFGFRMEIAKDESIDSGEVRFQFLWIEMSKLGLVLHFRTECCLQYLV